MAHTQPISVYFLELEMHNFPLCFRKSSDASVQRFDKSLEEFYALCDQLELCLVRHTHNLLVFPCSSEIVHHLLLLHKCPISIWLLDCQASFTITYSLWIDKAGSLVILSLLLLFSFPHSGLPTSAYPRALTVPSTLLTWSQQPPSLTPYRQSPCPTHSTSAWSSRRSPAPKTFITLYWSAPRKSQENASRKESCRNGHSIILSHGCSFSKVLYFFVMIDKDIHSLLIV